MSKKLDLAVIDRKGDALVVHNQKNNGLPCHLNSQECYSEEVEQKIRHWNSNDQQLVDRKSRTLSCKKTSPIEPA